MKLLPTIFLTSALLVSMSSFANETSNDAQSSPPTTTEQTTTPATTDAVVIVSTQDDLTQTDTNEESHAEHTDATPPTTLSEQPEATATPQP